MSDKFDELVEKLVLKNKLNEDTLGKLMKAIIDFTHAICSTTEYKDYVVPLKIMADDIETLKTHYDKVLDSIINE